MRSDVLRVYKALHSWTGVIAGMALFIAFFAGAITMFQQPIIRWLTPPAVVLPTVTLMQADDLLQAVLQAHPESSEDMTLYLSTDAGNTAPLIWEKLAKNESPAASWHASLDSRGKLIAEPVYISAFPKLVDLLHQTAGLPGKLGRDQAGVYVMGVVSILYFLALISGLIVLLPTLADDFLALRRGKNNKRFWLDAHNVIGITSFPFHIVIALTAIVFAFHDLFYAGLKLMVYGDIPLFPRPEVKTMAEQSADKLLPLSNLLSRISMFAPDLQIASIEYRNLDTPGAMARVAVALDGHVLRGAHFSYLTMQPYTGEFIYTDATPGKMETWMGIVTSFFALHFGNFGGNFVRSLYFLLGISGAFVFFSGNLLWVESRRKRLRKHMTTVSQTRSAYIMAALTVGVCLGAVAGIGLSMVSAKWLYSWVEHLDRWHIGIYYTTFLTSVAWAILVGAPRAAIHLLRLCAFIALAIPLSGIASNVWDGFGWASTDTASIGVDLAALLFCTMFAYLASVTKTRYLTGTPDSVWSAQHKTDSEGLNRSRTVGG